MRTQSLLIITLVIIVLAVMGIIIFLPSTSPNSSLISDRQKDSIANNSQPTDSQSTNPSGSSTDQPGKTQNGATADASGQAGTDTPQPQPGVNGALVDSSSSTPSSGQSAKIASANASSPQSIRNGIAGKVRSSQGKPLSGAAIQAEGSPLVLSNAQGEFRIDGVAQPMVTVTAQLAGFQTLKRENVPTGTANLDLVMIPEGALAGKVLDQFGDPIALAQIQSRALQGIWAVETSADAEGRFLIAETPQTRIRLQASQEGFDDSGAGSMEIDLPSNQEAVLRLNRPTFSISGHVLTQENQQGLADFKLKAVLQDAGSTPEEQTVATDGTGLYQFNNLRQGTYVVSSLARENTQLNYVIPLINDFKSVRLYEKSASNVDFTAVAGRTVSGVVIDSNNQPVSGAEVTVAGLQSVQTISNNNGQYRLTGVPVTGGQTLDRLSIRLQASHSEYGTGFSDPLPSDSEREIANISITLQGLTNLTGSVADRNGTPVGDVRIQLLNLALGQVQETNTNQAGEFTFSQVAVTRESLTTFGGTHQITAEKENYSTVREQIVLQPGQQQTVKLTMENGGQIQGRVLDPSSQPLAGVNVTTQLPRGGIAQSVSDQYGLYSLSGLPEGAFDLHFRVDSDPPLTGVLYQIAAGSGGADITLTLGKWDLMGTVLNAQTGERIFQYMLNIEGTPKDPRGKPYVLNRSVNTPDGTYHVTLTEPGIYRVRFIASGFHPLEEKADIAPTTMRLQYINPQLQPLVTTGQIQGSFAAPEGIALAGVNIPGVQAFPTQGNSFILEGIPAGNHDLIFHVYEKSSEAVFELGVLLNVSVVENQTTDLGQISPQNLAGRSRNF